MPRISVIIPTYNRKNILKETLLSFKNQTCTDFEIIVADDGSTDGTKEMVKSLRLPCPLKHLRHENAGRSAARNMGIKEAKGEIILFLDDHIIVDKRLLEEHIRCHEKFSPDNVCAVKGKVFFINNPAEAPQETKYLKAREIKSCPGEQNPLRMFYTHNLSVKKEALIKVRGFDEDFKEYGFQDQELGHRLRKAGYRFKFNPNAVGYIFSVNLNFEKRCDKSRQAGRSAVIFSQKHPSLRFQLGAHFLNILAYKFLSRRSNWWLKRLEKKLSAAKRTGNKALLKKYEDRIRYFYFLLGVYEKTKGIDWKRRRLLLVSHLADLSGAPISLFFLAKNLNRIKYEVTFAVPEEGPLVNKLKAAGIDFVITGKAFKTIRIYRLIKERKIDLVHANTAAGGFAALAGKLAAIPVVWHIREDLKGRFLFTKTIRILSDKIILLSRYMLSYFAENPQKIKVVANGVEIQEFETSSAGEMRKEFGIEAETPVAGMVGSIEERKGIRYFIEAASLLKTEFPNAKYLIVGKHLPGRKNYQTKMENLAEKMGVKNDIIFAGLRNDIPRLMKMLDVVVAPSLAEPFGRTVIEGMAAKKPVVGSNCGGIKEIVLHNKTGLLVSPGNAKELATAIAQLFKNPGLREKMGKEGFKRARELYSIDKHAQLVERIYQDLLK